MKKPKLTNHVAIVLDSSGSMQSCAFDVVNAFNASVDAIREGALKEKQVTTVSFYTFGEYGYGHTRRRAFNQPVSALARLNHPDYKPHGSTPLFDAVAEAITDLSKLPDANDKNTSFLLLVKTDGEENGSVVYNASRLRELMRKVNATDRWTIAFLLPPGAKRNFCERFDFPEGNVREWEGTRQGVEQASVATTRGVSNYFISRSAGQTATKSFYTDLSAVKPTQIRRALDDIANDVKIWTVPSEVGISEFVEKKTRKPYAKGTAFYQLTKPELVQENKEILVMEKGKTAVYAGDDAREVLGIPEGRVRIKPGNHANYDVFVQSTSTNRKLVRGSKLVVKAA